MPPGHSVCPDLGSNGLPDGPSQSAPAAEGLLQPGVDLPHELLPHLVRGLQRCLLEAAQGLVHVSGQAGQPLILMDLLLGKLGLRIRGV